jgi:serine/threonine protein kinase
MKFKSITNQLESLKLINCESVQLTAILKGDESQPDYQIALEHLGSCDRCQRQLDEMFVHDGMLSEVSSVLRDSGEHVISQYELQTTDDDFDRTVDYFPDKQASDLSSELRFLKPAAHPELLGRLGRYDIERVVGVGGTGIVLKAYDTELHRVVALKVLASHLAHHASSRVRFAREARAAAAVLHPNVLPIYNVEAEGESPYLVMQYVAGESLQSRVDRVGPLSVEESLRIAKQTAAALAAAHQQGLIHRDVKPANILLEDKTDRVVLSDFGLARTADDASITRTGVVAGTPQYMSPEQASGEAIDFRSDLFSLGSVLYFMLAGRPPFRGSSAVAILHRICKYTHDPITTVNHQVPLEVCKLLDTLLRKKPQQRVSTALEAADKLENLLSKHQSGCLRLGKSQERWKLVSAVLATVVCVGTFAWLWKAPVRNGEVAEKQISVAEKEGRSMADMTPNTNDIEAQGSEIVIDQSILQSSNDPAMDLLIEYPLREINQSMSKLDSDLRSFESRPIIDPLTEFMLQAITENQNPNQ